VRDCIFLVADETMKATLNAFLSRTGKHLSLQCSDFAFDMREDLISPVGDYDSGVYQSAHEYLASYRDTHRYAVAVFDKEYGTERTADQSRDHVVAELERSGWSRDRFEVVVIDPELELWLWTGTPHVKTAFRCADQPQDWLEANGWWNAGEPKPHDPKEAAQALLRHGGRRKFDKTLHMEIVSKSSVANCQDPAFCMLRTALQGWFPSEWAQ
jgi:hypothetical protein